MRGLGIYAPLGSDQSDFEPGPNPSRSIFTPRPDLGQGGRASAQIAKQLDRTETRTQAR